MQNTQEFSLKTFEIEKVAAFCYEPSTLDPASIFVNGSAEVLEEFQKIMAHSGLLGAKFFNPYLGKEEELPTNPSDFNLRHLQIIARNEAVNVNGVMKTRLYHGLLTEDQVARIRSLVKLTTVSGLVWATHTGGYRHKRERFETPQLNLLVDQAGLQWQGDFRNTGGMHFYPSQTSHRSLPAHYLEWQEDMYRLHYGEERPKHASAHQLSTLWSGVLGVVDLNSVAKALAQEFHQALDAVVFQAERDLPADAKVNFKFCRAGMGFFLSGLMGDKSMVRVARLQGIADALSDLCALPLAERAKKLGKVARLVLVHSDEAPYSDAILAKIEDLTRTLGLEWGGVPEEDSFKPLAGFINATTNCADPHAMPGNEGGPSSVDACIAYNANIHLHNAAFNPLMRQRIISSSPSLAASLAEHSLFAAAASIPTEDRAKSFEPA